LLANQSFASATSKYFFNSLSYKRRLAHASDQDRFPPVSRCWRGIRVEQRIEIVLSVRTSFFARPALARHWLYGLNQLNNSSISERRLLTPAREIAQEGRFQFSDNAVSYEELEAFFDPPCKAS
jgi:hypothetical protein